MAATKKQIANLIPTVKGEVRNPNGRPLKLISSINIELKTEGYQPITPSQLMDGYELMMNLTESKIKEIVGDPNSPMVYRIIGKAMLSPKGSDMLERMIDRLYGKARQAVDVKAQVVSDSNITIMPVGEFYKLANNENEIDE